MERNGLDQTEPPVLAPNRKPGWGELLLYLVVGFGVFLAGSVALALVFQEINILLSLAIYGLNFLSFAGSAYWLGVRRKGLTWREFGLRRFAWPWLVAGLTAALALIPIRYAAALLAQMLTGGGLEDVQARMDILAPSGQPVLNFLVTLFGAGLVGPLGEELYFRGLIHRWFWSRFRFWPRVLASSSIFALGHLDSVAVAASSFFLGMVAAVAFERSRSLWVPIAIHIVNNSLAVILVYAALAIQSRLGGG